MALSPAIPQLPMADIEETERFYTEILGFSVTAKYPAQNFLMLKRDQAEIHFLGYSREEAKKIGSVSSVYIYPTNVDEVAKEFAERGAVFRYGPENKPWGMYEMQIDDPCGNAIRFGTPIK